MTTAPISWIAMLALALAGCGKDPGGPGGDSDDDTDTDTDTGGAGDPVFAGDLTYRTTFDGETLCDLDVALTGAAYAGPCEGCEYAFAVDAEITRDASDPWCSPEPTLTYLERPGYAHPVWAWSAEWDGRQDVLATGYTREYAGTEYGSYWDILAYEGSPVGTVTRSGDDFAWTVAYTREYVSRTNTYFETCGTYAGSSSNGTTSGSAVSATGTLPCAGANGYYASDIVDVFTFEAPAYATARVVVDTPHATTAFDPIVWIADTTDDCLLNDYAWPEGHFGDDDWECTNTPPDGGGCPSYDVVNPRSRETTYRVVVGGFDDCEPIGEYELRVDIRSDTSPDAALTQTADDVNRWSEQRVPYTVELTGSGTVTR